MGFNFFLMLFLCMNEVFGRRAFGVLKIEAESRQAFFYFFGRINYN